jgi:hypothetical protein
LQGTLRLLLCWPSVRLLRRRLLLLLLLGACATPCSAEWRARQLSFPFPGKAIDTCKMRSGTLCTFALLLSKLCNSLPLGRWRDSLL